MTKRTFSSKSDIDKIPLAINGQVDYFDAKLTGLGLRVGAKTKTFFVKVDVKDPAKPKGYRTVRKTLGRYGELTLEQARKELVGYDDKEKGFIPGKRLEIKRGDTTVNGSGITLNEMLFAYFREKRTKDGKSFKPATVNGYTNIITRQFESWLPMTLKDVTKLAPDLVIDRYKMAEVNNGAYGARNAFVMLTAIINYAIVKYPGVILSNPLYVLRLGKHMKRIESRTDRLDGNDFQVFHKGIQAFNEITRDCYLLCLYHGLRSEEAAGLRWEYVSMEKQEITIPDTKNRQALHVPLCRQSLVILKQRREKNPDGNEWVFPSLLRPQNLNKTGHVRLMAAELRMKTSLNITVHGLRRTFITTARKLKIFEDADRLTNHLDSSISGRHYDGTDVDDLRQPLQMIANEIERLMLHGTVGKVIQLASAFG